jgi:hypothetical protein
MDFLTNNWQAIGAVILFAASEIIGMSPWKTNSVVQVVIAVLGKIFRKGA